MIGNIALATLLIMSNPLLKSEDVEVKKDIIQPLYFLDFSAWIAFDGYVYQKEGKGGGKFTFDQNYFYFNFRGNLKPTLGFFGELEVEHSGKEFRFDRVFINWEPFSFLTLRAGRFYAPVGKEIKFYQSPLRKLVTRPKPTDELILDEWRDIGVEALFTYPGNSPYFSLEFAFFNGPNKPYKEGRQFLDNNKDKFVAVQPSIYPIKGLEIGGSFSTGRYDDNNTKRLTFLTGHIYFNRSPFYVLTEYIFKHYDNPDGDGTLTDQGAYFLGEYKFLRGRKGINYLSAVFRYDFLNPDGDEREHSFSFGINYSPISRVILKTEVQINKEKPVEKKNNGFLFSFVLSL